MQLPSGGQVCVKGNIVNVSAENITTVQMMYVVFNINEDQVEFEGQCN